ncbi:hypothetical protein CYLTODRAFT_180334 [Cylindrobasidium torrendii FP15055 ss-10]|uniref:Uncharacterized protein n=1 Tax=Cylindrobasidium torrendii FP15055 ss-10 TaxID=1314674 RepID=A0A0D7AWY8_9AGAR|nr:hypothetical protein CYLTODRAFT_180334 [Cylindrobasidium torrendii FP15055 ss-10]
MGKTPRAMLYLHRSVQTTSHILCRPERRRLGSRRGSGAFVLSLHAFMVKQRRPILPSANLLPYRVAQIHLLYQHVKASALRSSMVVVLRHDHRSRARRTPSPLPRCPRAL